MLKLKSSEICVVYLLCVVSLVDSIFCYFFLGLFLSFCHVFFLLNGFFGWF